MLFNTNDSSTLLGAITAHRQYKSDKTDYANVLSYFNDNHQDKFLEFDIDSIANISDRVKETLKSIQEEAKKTGKTGAEALGDVEIAMDEVGSKGTKLGAVFKNVGKTLLNAFASAALSWGITKLGEGIKWVYDNWLTNNAEIERQKKALEEVTQATEKYTRTIESIDEETAKYEELSEKLKDSTLTTSELVQVKSDLKAIQDQLIEQYGSEASGLDLVNGKYDEQIEKIKELKKEEAKKYLYGDEGVLNGDNLDNVLKAINGKPNKSSIDLFRGVNAVGTPSENINNRYGGVDIQSVVDKYSAFSIGRRTTGKDEQTLILSFDINKGVKKEEAQKQLTDFFAELNSLYPNNKEVQKFIDKVSNIDIGYDEEEAKKTRDSIKKIIESWLLYNDKDDIASNAKQAVDDYNEALETYLADDSVDNEKALNDAFKKIGESRAAISTLIANSNIPDELRSYFAEFLNSIFDDKLLSPSERLNKYFEDATGTVKAAYGDLTRGLSEAEKNAFINLLPEDVQVLTIEEIIKLIKEAQEIATENPVEIEIKASAAVDSMASAKQAINSLDELYNQVVKMEEKDGQVTGFADPTLINNVESGFKDFIKEASESGKDVTELNSALEEFERIMIEQPNDAETASKAMDDLITAYIDQTDIIKNLTEENAEWSIKQLEVMGIENAQEVVTTRLSKASKKVSEAISKLNGVLIENASALKKSKKGTDEYKKAITNLVDPVKEALSIYNRDGSPLFTPDVDERFIEQYLDDINEMADGSMEALNRVRQAAAKEAFLRVNVSIPTDVAENQANQLMNIIGQVEDKNIEVGAYIDDAPFLDSLAEMMRSSDQTADAVAAAFQSMGYEVEWVPRPYTVEYVKANQSNIKDTKAYQAMLETAKAKVDVPALRIKRSGSAGAGAHYTGGSSSSSDSSSGGGGGGSEPTQPKDDTEETFDWIEVAIQRIEEEMARLDKIVGNSYIKWSDRNSALTDEINKTTEAIKAQELAEEEYYRNANELQVNDGKGLNDDDYGENDYLVKEHDQKLLDEARAIWATGEYQEKVKHGLLTGDDIEKIQNKYLVETIKTYQEWINKGIAAGDAADDLRIKLGDLAKTRFDNVKEEFNELIAYITHAADVIDEKINRTEKKGYFVDKQYYKDLLSLEEDNYAKLEQKRAEMIKKRDEAVEKGFIQEGSSAWNQMTQEINDVTLAIEQSETQMVEYNNTMRQLDWDMFDYIEERISRINSEASFLVDLMSEEKLVDDNGVFTSQGEATNALHAVQYETYMRQARDYAEERKKIEEEIAKDPGNKELIKRREELIDLEQESIKNAQQEKEAIKSLVQEAINKAIESLQKLIDEQKTAIREAKDLYDYQQNLKKQTENISNIRKQLSAYAGDDSEENRARVQKLQQQLEEAEQQLQETEWDKYISETEKFLDEMMEDYSETLNKKLEDIDALVSEMIEHANNNADTTKETIREETDKVGYTLTDEFGNIINGDHDRMVTDLQGMTDSIKDSITNVQSVIENIKEYVAEMAEYGKKSDSDSDGSGSGSDGGSGSDTGKKDDSKKSDGTKKDDGKKDDGKKSDDSGKSSTLTDKDYYGVALAIINGNYGWGSGSTLAANLKAKGFDAKKVQDIIDKMYAEGYIHSGAWVGRYQGITDLSPYAFNKYAKGSKRIPSDQLAWTQEEGQELIFRSSDGAMLTPLKAGDKVFTAQMTDNLWNLAKTKYTTASVPMGSSTKAVTVNNVNNISLPNVTNYEQFKTQLQNDPRMTKFIQQITLGEVSNGIKLNKKKY